MAKNKKKRGENRGETGERKKTHRRLAIGGARLQISFSVVLMAAIAVASGHLRETLSYAAAVVLHEFAHATVAARLGYTLDVLKIMPYGAALTGRFESARVRDEFLIAIVGPLSNLVFAVVFVAVWWLVPSLFYYTEVYVTANVFTAVINLLPVFPLDGGRAALALLSVKKPREKAYRALRIIGFVISAVGIVCAVIFFRRLNFSYFTFLVFVLSSAVFPDKSSAYRRLYGMSYIMEKIKTGLPVREIMVHTDTTLLSCSGLLNPNYYSRFIVTDDKMTRRGEIDETALEDYLVAYPLDTPVLQALQSSNSLNRDKQPRK